MKEFFFDLMFSAGRVILLIMAFNMFAMLLIFTIWIFG